MTRQAMLGNSRTGITFIYGIGNKILNAGESELSVKFSLPRICFGAAVEGSQAMSELIGGIGLEVVVFREAVGVSAGGGVTVAIGVEVGTAGPAGGVFLDEAHQGGAVESGAVEVEAGFAVEFSAGPAVAQLEGGRAGRVDGGAVDGIAPGAEILQCCLLGLSRPRATPVRLQE